MPSTHNSEWLNYSFPTGAVNSSAAGVNYTGGLAFQVSTPKTIDKLSWWRQGASGTKPSNLRLWNANTGTEIGRCSTVTDDGATGWQDCALDANVAVYPGTRYKVSEDNVTSTPDGGCTVTGTPATGDYFFFSPVITGYKVPAGYGFPNFDDTNGYIRGLDAHTLIGDIPPTEPTTADQLTDWLADTSDNTHKDTSPVPGLPWTTKQAVDAAAVTGDDTNTKVSNGLNFAGGLQQLSDDLAHTLQMASDWLASGSTTIFTDLKNRILGASGGGGSAFFGPDGTQVSAGVEALLQRSTNAQVGFPAAPWTLVDESDWDDAIAWAVPADLYVVTVTTLPAGAVDNGRAGVPVYYRLAWWTPLNGTFAQERRWLDFASGHLIDPAGRMPGLLLQTYQGGAGHLQAWTLNV